MADRMPGDRAEAEGQGAFDPKVSAGLFVGISSFEDERIPDVPCAVNDAVDLAHLFTMELGLVLPERTVLLLGGRPRKPESIERLERLVEHGARLRSARVSDIYRYLGELTRGTKERGLFVLTVATQGASVQGDDFLVATDSLKEHILRTGVSAAAMFDQVARAGAGRRLVLLDASRERLLIADTREGRRLNTRMQGKGEVAVPTFAKAVTHATGLAVLSSAALGEFAYDDWERKNGVFTAAVLDGLRGEASVGPDGWITIRALADFCQERVTAWVRLHRPDHTAISSGITLLFEGTVEALPLAFHPEARREQQQYYRQRRESALARFRENQGRVLTGAMWDQVVAGLPVEGFSFETERLLEKIEILDGTERAQRCLRDFLRELASGVNPPRRNEGWNKEMPAGFDVFLSHNSKDMPAVRELAVALRARGLKVWLDEWELVPGRPWQEALEEIIETTRCSAVLVGKDGLGPWQDEEMRGCLSEFVSRKVPVIPVLLPGAPEAPKLPFLLRRFTWVDLREGLTEEGIDRLQWGITGKRPDRPNLSSLSAAPVSHKRAVECTLTADGVATSTTVIFEGVRTDSQISLHPLTPEAAALLGKCWIGKQDIVPGTSEPQAGSFTVNHPALLRDVVATFRFFVSD